MKFILGKKIEMSQIFDEGGNVVPVTLIQAGPCYVLQIKTDKKDGYQAIQIGFEKLKQKKVKKPLKQKPYRFLKEFGGDISKYKIDDEIKVDVFEEGDIVKVSGTSKGKGFAGVVKRHGFAGGPASHGQKDRLRAPGSIGTSFPERVPKGRRMPGRMGGERVTVRGSEVIKIDKKNNLMAVKGAVPGHRGSLVEISLMGHKERAVPKAE